MDYHLGNFKAHIAGSFLLRKDANEILPQLELSYRILNNRGAIRAGWVGEASNNHFHFLSSYNPYIDTRLDSINTMISRRMFVGLTGASDKLIYEVSAGYTTFEEMGFFLQKEDDTEPFDPIYDNGSYISVEGSLRYEVLKHLSLRLQLLQRFYSLDNENKPWHRPSFDLDGQITYSGGTDKYQVSLLFHGQNGLPYRTPGGTESTLDPLIDLSLHAQYYVTQAIGVFTEINNIMGNNRERWAGYPSYGFNVKGGVVFRIPY